MDINNAMMNILQFPVKIYNHQVKKQVFMEWVGYYNVNHNY